MLGEGSQRRPSCPCVPPPRVPVPAGSPGRSPGSRRPRRASPSGCCSRRGSGRCTWSRPRLSSGGCRGWVAVGTSGRGGCSAQSTPGEGSGTTPTPCQAPPRTLPMGSQEFPASQAVQHPGTSWQGGHRAEQGHPVGCQPPALHPSHSECTMEGRGTMTA